MTHSVASDLGLHCLHMSNKKGARLIWVYFLISALLSTIYFWQVITNEKINNRDCSLLA